MADASSTATNWPSWRPASTPNGLVARCWTRLAELPELEREAVELVHLCGLAPKEAAEALGVPKGAMRTRLYRAMARLRTAVEDEVEAR